MHKRLLVATALAAATALSAAGPAAATTKSSTTVKLQSWETPQQAATWEQADWRQTLAYCESLKDQFPSRVCGNSVTGKRALKRGHKYVVTVTGLVSVAKVWANTTCGTPETLPDGRLAGTDAQFEFADANDAATCYLGSGPVTWDAFRWSLGGRNTFVHPVADGKPTAPATGHAYIFTVTGKGKKPVFKWYDVATTDNSGTLTIVYREKLPKKKAKTAA